MPGIVMEMEEEKGTEEDKESKLEEIASPQRSILEFFKSPTKPDEKPKNLLSYFGKQAPKQKESTDTVSSKTKTEKANGKVNGFQNGINSKEQNQKVEINISSLNSSISEFEGQDSLTKIKKTEKKKGTKKSLKANNEALKENAESKTKDISKTKKKNVEKDIIEKIQKKEVHKETQKRKKAKDKDEKLSKDKQEKITDESTKTNKDNARKSEQNEDENSGISYLDFLKSLENKSEEKGNEIITDKTETETMIVNDCKQSETLTGNGVGESEVEADGDNDKSEEAVAAEDSKHDSSCDENYPSITSFFTKLSGPAPKQSISTQNSPKTLTTKADIHSEPTPPKITKGNKSEKTKVCASAESDSTLNEIEILSSEVVKVESPAKKRSIKQKDKPVKSARKSLNQKLTETVEISDDSITVDATETKEALDRKKAFLQSDNIQSGSHKTSQATLSFVKGGFQMSSKPSHKTRIRKSVPEEMTCESPLSKSTPVKRGQGRPPSSTIGGEKTPGSTKGRGRPPGSTNKIKKNASDGSKHELSNVSVLEDGVEKSEDTIEVYDDKATQKRRSLRKKKKYKVDMISIDTKNRTPIRMRLTRCNKSGSSTDEASFSLKPKSNIKQTRAQKLLEKAKKTKAGKSPELKLQIKHAIEKNKKKGSKLKESAAEKRKPVENKNENSSRRRSSRLSDKFHVSREESQDDNDDDEIMIIDDDEDNKGKKKKQKDLSTPRKGRKPSTPKTPLQNKTTSKGTPKKPSGKLAPIFMKKKAGEKVEEPKKPVLDPEQERQRREFLMSGVPEALKKQTIAASATVILSDLPPFPAIKHVQQTEDIVGKSGIDIWNLASVQLKIKKCEETDNTGVIQTYWNHGLLEKDKNMCDLSKIKLFKQHSKVEGSLEEPLLKEIQRVSPSYNVDKMYKLLKEKKEDQDAEMTYDIEEQKDSKSKKDESADTGKEVKKKTKRRSLRLKKKDEVMEVIDLGSPEPVIEETSSGDNKQEIAIVVPWTDKYQPTHSSEIVGNSNNVKKLKTWLIEWKHKVDKEAKKMKKLAMKESKNRTKEKEDDWWADDDSDFNVDSEGSEEEEDKLCNTVMLMGPTGIGKSTTVYALAQEIGFKVFEVNASSIRNGKRILTQLQEATQSHRVSHNKHGDAGPASIFTQGNKPSPRKKPEKNVPTSFANFFNKTTNSIQVEIEKSKKSNDSKNRRKRKRDLEESDAEKTPKKKKGKDEKGVKFDGLIPTTSNQTAATNQGLNLSSTSLILFEDVDVVFEEDKGFWSAIQTFMNSTKIPIVLTTNDVTLSSKFEGRYEQFLFKTPSMKQTTVYLQLICLAESIRTNSEEIMTLVKVLSGDIRRCLLALQYWIESGGGTLQAVQKIISPVKLKPLPLSEDTCSQEAIKPSSISGDSKSRFDDDDDFVVIKPVVNKRKRPLISDDESSSSAQTFPLPKESTVKPEAALQSSVHLSCLNSSLGLSLGGSEGIMNLLKQLVKGQRDDLVTVVTEACDQYRKLMYNIVYNTYIDLLPMPKSRQTTPPSIKTKIKEKKTQLKRIKTFDLYDSEASNDGILDEPREESLEETKTEETKEEKVAIIRSLDQLTEFYDNMSFIDSVTIGSEVPESSNSFILHSKRCLHDTDITSSLEYIDKDNLCSEIEVRALYKLCTNQRHLQDTLKGQHIESVSIPSAGSQSQGVLVNRASNSKNLVLKKASNNVMSNLPLAVRCHQRSVVMDYMPTLREISKSEKLREMAKIKRRFHHYFDNIGLNFKDTTLDVMFTSFQ
ncbi:ATPase family AAA domain-containing protein 5-like isoform X2 [Mytilus californianus]|uniref:ATPase family AAA domain-containing protein 5-like isoform X2 n=1 Tax=Mytilus californianus TaxID=6549 RepID=UPI0022457A7B|nr:ATPase family AAA domain-containing protein 5-like isoform X2 [Mytilus californianus]